MTVTVRNLNADIILEDTLRWELGEGWTIVPEHMPVEIAPLGSYTANFTVKNTGIVYPVPTLSLRY
ncbi:hypothetical protein AMJ40_04305, partial [candidate division TA06 bacterium DG_26]